MALANLKPIKLYSLATQNGVRVSTFFEDLKNEYSLPYECVLVLVVPFPWAIRPNVIYRVEVIEISTNRQKEPWFLAINPNGRMSVHIP
jgi:glutathione S-transferase